MCGVHLFQGVGVAPYNMSYNGVLTHHIQAQLDEENDLWEQVRYHAAIPFCRSAPESVGWRWRALRWVHALVCVAAVPPVW